MPNEPTSQPEYVTLAHLLRPQGRRGELLADLHTAFPELLAAGATAFIVPANADGPFPGANRKLIESQWMPTGKNAGRIVLKLAGCDSINDAEKIAGSDLIIPAAERPTLDADTFYVADLIGATLFNGDTPVGEVVDVEFATSPDGKTRLADAAPLLSILPTNSAPDTEPILIPFVRAQLSSVDTTSRSIHMNLPEGLLDPTT